MKTPITYYGGKQTMLKHLLVMIPEHRIYCEPFFGGGALFFAKPKAEVEVINDVNGEVVNFFKVLKTKFPALQKEIQATLHSRELYKKAMKIYNNPKGHSDVDRAWALWTATNQGFAGMIGSWGFGTTNSKEKSLANKRENFINVYEERLKTVQVENNDALKVIARCNEKDAFIYCDPPYIGSDQGHYSGYTEAQYKTLLDALAKLKGKFLLSSYPSKILSQYIKKYKWKTKSVEKFVAVTKLTDKKKTEMLVYNYDDKLAGQFMERNSLAGVEDEDYPALRKAKEDASTYHLLPTEKLKKLLLIEKGSEYQDGLKPHIIARKSMLEKLIAERENKISAPQTKTPMKKKANPYKDISIECYFIDRFLKFHDQILYKNTFGIFIDELQKAMQSKKITKKSPVANEIMEIQTALVKQFNTMRVATHFVLKHTTIKRLKGIIARWENAAEDIDHEYAKSKKKPVDLQGLNGLNKVNVMSSTDFTNLQFNTIGFKDKWLDFIGDPAPGFTAMVFGMPKMGKSYLCVDFAGYLARNHGKVLYVAKEEKLDKTLQDKLKEKNVAHENLTVADGIPPSLADYDFIFLDSVNKLGLTSKDLEKLKTENKGKSFIYIFQATKAGKFKGNNEFQHDVDVVIEVPERGKAIQYGRFNQGGDISIFPEALPVAA